MKLVKYKTRKGLKKPKSEFEEAIRKSKRFMNITKRLKRHEEFEKKSNEQVQYEKGNCLKCGLYNGYDGCCDRGKGECPKEMHSGKGNQGVCDSKHNIPKRVVSLGLAIRKMQRQTNSMHKVIGKILADMKAFEKEQDGHIFLDNMPNWKLLIKGIEALKDE